jgi:hypothetical protein
VSSRESARQSFEKVNLEISTTSQSLSDPDSKLTFAKIRPGAGHGMLLLTFDNCDDRQEFNDVTAAESVQTSDLCKSEFIRNNPNREVPSSFRNSFTSARPDFGYHGSSDSVKLLVMRIRCLNLLQCHSRVQNPQNLALDLSLALQNPSAA